MEVMKTEIKKMKLRGIGACWLLTNTAIPMTRQMNPPAARDQSRIREFDVFELRDM